MDGMVFARYASAFYGPFREALASAPRPGSADRIIPPNKKTYQQVCYSINEISARVGGAHTRCIHTYTNFACISNSRTSKKVPLPVSAYRPLPTPRTIKHALTVHALAGITWQMSLFVRVFDNPKLCSNQISASCEYEIPNR